MKRTYAIVALITLLSQALGFVRELLFAYYQGASGLVEAFQVAETVPLLFTQMIVGSVPLAITPLIVRSEVASPGRGRVIFATLTTLTFLAMLALTAVVVFLSPQILSAIAPGFTGFRLETACRIAALLAPNILCVSLLALCTSLINAEGNFVYPSAATLCLNVGTVLAQIVFKGDVFRVATGATVGGLAAFFLCALYLHRRHRLPALLGSFDAAVLPAVSSALAPIVMFVMLTSLALVLDKTIASYGRPGSVAFISYAFKVIYIPVHLFSMSFVRVMIQPLAQHYGSGETEQARRVVRRVVGTCVALGVPLSIGIFFFRALIVQLLFQRGNFSAADAAATASCIGAYSFGLVGMVLNAFFLGVACSMGRYALPIRVLMLQLPLCCSISWLLLPSLGAAGIATGNAIAYTVATVQWVTLLRGLKQLPVSGAAVPAPAAPCSI